MVHTEDESRTEPEPEEGPSRRLGHVESDARGRNVWRWARDLIDSTSVLLKRLENTELELEPTQKVKRRIAKSSQPPSRSRAPAPDLTIEADDGRDAGGGFDPYNSR